MRHLNSSSIGFGCFFFGAFAQDSAALCKYHSQDIVPSPKVKYTTLIELPTTEKIMEAATGDKEFWIVDVLATFALCIRRNRHQLQLESHYGQREHLQFHLQDISALSTDSDLKVIVEPADRFCDCGRERPPQFVPPPTRTSRSSLPLCSRTLNSGG